jgi:hypothetical protein
MSQTTNPSRPPLRAEPRPGSPTALRPDAVPPGLGQPDPVPRSAATPPTGIAAAPSGLLRSTLKAGGVAATFLVLVYLPAEYGVDPTGLGTVLGLTEIGEIKQQLRAEAEADAVLAASPASTVLPREVLGRLDNLEAAIAAIAAALNVQPSLTGAAPVAAVPTTPAPEAAASTTSMEAAEALATPASAEPAPEGAEPAWQDTYEVTLAPGEASR